MKRFNGKFSLQGLKSYIRCPRAFYFANIMGLKAENFSEQYLAARAAKKAIQSAHLANDLDAGKLIHSFLEIFLGEKESLRGETTGEINLDDWQAMLSTYADNPFNCEMKILAQDTRYEFEIRPARAFYKFQGWLDQLVEVDAELLEAEFPGVKLETGKKKIIIHRSLKFGRKSLTSPFELALNREVDLAALALTIGMINNGNGPVDHNLPYPDLFALYFLRDHIPYRDDSGTYIRTSDGEHVPCDIVDTPCLLGKKSQPCKGSRTYCTKKPRGPGMYFTKRNDIRLKKIPRELMPVCAAIRMGQFPRAVGELCSNYCDYRVPCENEFLSG